MKVATPTEAESLIAAGRPTNHWILQANANRYDINQALAKLVSVRCHLGLML